MNTLTLVTGVTGTVGSALTRALVEQGRSVRCLVRCPQKAENLGIGGVEFVRGDLTDRASIGAAFEGVTHVFHAAGLPEQWVPDNSIFERINTGGTQYMVDMALAQNVSSFVYVSTQDMFDLTANPFDETMPGKEPLLSAYERSKQKAEDIVKCASSQSLPAIFIHPAAVYGPGAVEIGGLNRLLSNLLNNNLPILLNGGMPLVLNTDLARGMLVAEQKAAVGEHFIFSESYQSLSEIAQAIQMRVPGVNMPKIMPNILAGIIAGAGELISKMTKGKPLVSKAELGVLRREGRPNSAKAQAQLDWVPTPFTEGLAKTILWLEEQSNE